MAQTPMIEAIASISLASCVNVLAVEAMSAIAVKQLPTMIEKVRLRFNIFCLRIDATKTSFIIKCITSGGRLISCSCISSRFLCWCRCFLQHLPRLVVLRCRLCSLLLRQSRLARLHTDLLVQQLSLMRSHNLRR